MCKYLGTVSFSECLVVNCKARLEMTKAHSFFFFLSEYQLLHNLLFYLDSMHLRHLLSLVAA